MISCEKFTGYDYSVEESEGRTAVSGTITDLVTGDPISDALIEVGYARTATDSEGKFNLDYVLSVDEKRDQPVPVSVAKPDYFPVDTVLVIYDINNMLDLQMEYGRPTIRLVWNGIYQDKYVRQALIFDPQGIQNIDQVITEIYFDKMGENDYKGLSAVMDVKSEIDQYSAVYQVVVLPFLPDGWWVTERRYKITVQDKDGFFHIIDQRDQSVKSSEILCSPE